MDVYAQLHYTQNDAVHVWGFQDAARVWELLGNFHYSSEFVGGAEFPARLLGNDDA